MRPTTSDSMDVYTRLMWHARNGSTELGVRERSKLQDMLIDSYTENVMRMSDEQLLEEADDRGIL